MRALAKMKSKSASARVGVYGLPESQVYAHVFHTAHIEKQSIEQLVEKEAVETFPLDHSDMVISFSVAHANAKESDICILATHRDVLREWHLFFAKIGIFVPLYDGEILALFRGLRGELTKGATALVDIGAVTNTIGIFDALGMLHYIYSFEGAGDDLTESIAKTANLSFDDAEKLKITLDIENLPANLISILPSFFDRVCQEIKTGIKLFHDKQSVVVERVVLAGGTSNMNGMREYFSRALNLPVALAEAIVLDGAPIQKGQGIEAIGLALRLMQKNLIDKDPFFRNPTEQELRISGNIIPDKKNARMSGTAAFERPKEFQDIWKEKKKLQWQIFTFAMVIVIGIGAVAAAMWYQDQAQRKKEERIRLLTPQYTYSQNLSMAVPLTIPTRVYRFEVSSQPIPDFMYAEAQNALRRQLNDNEDFWRDPVNQLMEPGVKPITSIMYLIFDRQALRTIVKTKIDSQNTDGIPYDIGSIEYVAVKHDDTRGVGALVLDIIATVSSQAPLPQNVIPTPDQ